MAQKPSTNLVWLDLEMTGLDVETNLIIEMATIVTDSQLNVLAEGPVLVIHQSDEHLATMGEWVTKTHTGTGLVERVRASTTTEAEAEQQTIEFLENYVKAGESPLCGNSICMDRRFLARYMPKLCDFFHYRHIDVSTVKELAKRWRPELKSYAKEGGHQALADIRESIGELKYYRECFFKE
jgi:oligoribonuclease